MSSGFEVISAGIQATIQDLGRVGLAKIGVSSSGALDEYAFHNANKLLGNEYGSNMLEIVLGGVKLKVVGRTTFVLTGARVNATINNKPIKAWKTYEINDEDVVSLGFATSGVRVYLAVKGGFDVPSEYGSCSVSVKEKLGGTPLRVKEFLPFTSRVLKENRSLQSKYQPNYDKVLTLRVVAGYQWSMFEKKQKQKLFNSIYIVTGENNRMGYRLSGEKIVSTLQDIVSEPIAFGSIQIPAHGEPIVLLKERQTIGGYPKVGTVIPVDCFKLSQMKQDSKIRFELIEFDEAVEICREFYKNFKEF